MLKEYILKFERDSRCTEMWFMSEAGREAEFKAVRQVIGNEECANWDAYISRVITGMQEQGFVRIKK